MTNLFTKLFALILLIVISPMLIFVGILILLVDKECAIFKQKRLGIHQIPFTIYKLRSMKNGEITPFGRIIRKRF